jgi:hypothetical protein
MVQIRTAGSIAGRCGFARVIVLTSAPTTHLGSRTITDGPQRNVGRTKSWVLVH